jgi:hypothetical protein
MLQFSHVTHEDISGKEIHSLLTSGLDGAECLTSRLDRFTSGKEPRYPSNRRLGGSHKYFWSRENLLAPTRIRIPQSIPQPSRYTDYATPAPNK